MASLYLCIYACRCIVAADKTSTAAAVAMRLISFAALAAWQPQLQPAVEKKSKQPPIESAWFDSTGAKLAPSICSCYWDGDKAELLRAIRINAIRHKLGTNKLCVLGRGHNDLHLPPNADWNGVKGLSGDDTPTLRTPPVAQKSMRHFQRESNDATFFAVGIRSRRRWPKTTIIRWRSQGGGFFKGVWFAWSLAMKSQSRKNYFVTNRPRTWASFKCVSPKMLLTIQRAIAIPSPAWKRNGSGRGSKAKPNSKPLKSAHQLFRLFCHAHVLEASPFPKFNTGKYNNNFHLNT